MQGSFPEADGEIIFLLAIRMGSGIFRPMFARIVSVIAVLAIAVVTTVTYAHAASMSVRMHHDAYSDKMIQASDGSEFSGDCEQPCGLTDSGLCDIVCAGLSAFLPPVGSDVMRVCSPFSHDLPVGTIPASLAPGLAERPPRPRLL